MTLNSVMVVILRYSTEFDGFGANYVIIENAYIAAVLPAELHSPWAACSIYHRMVNKLFSII